MSCPRVYNRAAALVTLLTMSANSYSFAQSAALDRVNNFLTNLAEQKGYVSPTAASSARSAQPVSSREITTAMQDVASNISSKFASTHTPDFTPAEAAIFDDHSALNTPINNPDIYVPVVGVDYDIITATDLSLNGLLDDVSSIATGASAIGDAIDLMDVLGDHQVLPPDNGILAPTTSGAAGGATELTYNMDPLAGSVGLNKEMTRLTFEQGETNKPTTNQMFSSSNGILQLPEVFFGAEFIESESLEKRTAGASAELAPLALVAVNDLLSCVISDSRTQTKALQGYVALSEQGATSALKIVKPDGSVVQNFGERLDDGNYLVSSEREAALMTDCGSLELGPDALVSLMASEGVLKVRACSGPGHVRFQAGGQKININVGEELLIANDASLNAAAALDDDIAKRNVVKHVLNDNRVVYLSEFSMVTLLAYDATFRAPAADSNESVREAQGKILKSAAAIATVLRHHGRYYGGADSRIPVKAFAP